MLDAQHLSVSYGQHRALDSVSVHTDRGEIVVILGANGAGKTTLLKAIAGLVPCSGQVTMDGQAISGLEAHDIVESGLALVPEGRGIFGDLSVLENLTLGAYAARARQDERVNLNRVFGLFPKLNERRHQTARTMSGGEQQMVAIGRALMSAPSVLMLDEPSLGLSPLLSSDLFKALRTIRESGVGVLLVEQNARQSLAIADRAYLLENGSIVGDGPAAQMMRNTAVQEAYLGGAAGSSAAQTQIRSGVDRAAPRGDTEDSEDSDKSTHRGKHDRVIQAALASLSGTHEDVSTQLDAMPSGESLNRMVERAATIQRDHITRTAPGKSSHTLGGTPLTTTPNLDNVLADIEAAAANARAGHPATSLNGSNGGRRPRVHIITPNGRSPESGESGDSPPARPAIPVFRKPKIDIYRRRSPNGPLERDD